MQSTMAQRWDRWIGFWATQEDARLLALVRIAFGLVILWDFVEIWRLDLVVALFAGTDVGGLSDAAGRATPPVFYQAFPPTVASARGLHAVITGAALLFTLGIFSRGSALVLLIAWAQFSMVLPAADRGIDTLCRNVLLIFVFARADATWSLGAFFRTGRLAPAGIRIGVWGRYLIIGQLVLMYTMAGVQKTGLHWYPMGNFAALYFILQDPAIARFDFAFLEHQPWFFFSQVGTAGTIVFQDSYPLVLLWIHYRGTPDRPGRLRAFANRWHLDWVWIGTGALFHILLAATMELGIFPYAMLALYPAWLRSADLDGIRRWFRSRLHPDGAIVGEDPRGGRATVDPDGTV